MTQLIVIVQNMHQLTVIVCRTCSCQSKSISPRGIDRLSNSGCLEVIFYKFHNHRHRHLHHFWHQLYLPRHCHNHQGEERTHFGSTVFEAREASPLNIISYGEIEFLWRWNVNENNQLWWDWDRLFISYKIIFINQTSKVLLILKILGSVAS